MSQYTCLLYLIRELEKESGMTLTRIFKELRDDKRIDWNAIKEIEKASISNWNEVQTNWKYNTIRRFISKGLFPNGGDRVSNLTGAKAAVARQVETFVSTVNDDVDEVLVVDAAVHAIGGKFDVQDPTIEKQATFTEFVRSLTREYVRRRRHTNDREDIEDNATEGFEIMERHTTTITESTNSVNLLSNLNSNDCRMVLVEKEHTTQEQLRTTQEQLRTNQEEKKIEYLKEITTTFKCMVDRMFL